ncbi:Hypothetical protein HEAR1367 [Herminiimonas arsenicoxydans]|uniref:Uncharacterized protein n=1 Tax=Herminiimonas arsenicoxydans TaxID=204773 RepID=A4G4V2_HERAR|nr:Hypothetical protein HEAR1367 [Herminiimonas arsenicoxydans]
MASYLIIDWNDNHSYLKVNKNEKIA